jgi:hypothetical protein
MIYVFILMDGKGIALNCKINQNDFSRISSPERGRTADAGSKGRHVTATPQGHNFILGIFYFI